MEIQTSISLNIIITLFSIMFLGVYSLYLLSETQTKSTYSTGNMINLIIFILYNTFYILYLIISKNINILSTLIILININHLILIFKPNKKLIYSLLILYSINLIFWFKQT